ncbi:MAG: hypothetical protein LAP39_07445 [Acidobacteriia bacterium]|nr:hypothetical protein [Terriglobia bacterium]
MLTKVMALGALALLIGCGTKSTDNPTTTADAQKPAASAPAGFDNAKIAPAVTVPVGTALHVRLDQALDTQHSRAGEAFSATLAEPIVVGAETVVPKGTEFRGHVTASGASGRLKGRAVLGVTLDSFDLKGQTYRIETSADSRASAGHKKRNGLLIGGGAGLGAALGAVAGGGAGALIGAGAGAAAGTAGAAATGKKNTGFPAETLLTFSLRAPVRI